MTMSLCLRLSFAYDGADGNCGEISVISAPHLRLHCAITATCLCHVSVTVWLGSTVVLALC